MKPEKEFFNLSKAKLTKGGGLDCNYEVKEKTGNETYNEKFHQESAKDVHPDLSKSFERLKPIVARVWHLTFVRTLLLMPEFKASKLQSDLAEVAINEIMANIRVSSISISGQDENVGVVITAVMTADNNQKMAMNTHRIRFTDTKYGFEEELEEICGDIEQEVYEYLFEGKRAQLDLFSGVGSEGETEDEKSGKDASAGE